MTGNSWCVEQMTSQLLSSPSLERLPDVKTRAIPSLKKNLEALNHTKSKSTEEFDNMINQIKQRSSTLISTIEIAKDRLINRCISDKDASHTFLNKLEDKLSTGIAGIESAAHSSEQALKMDRDPPISDVKISNEVTGTTGTMQTRLSPAAQAVLILWI
jgi:hypothetical protein